MTEKHLNNIEELIGRKFPEMFKKYILGNYVSGERNYLIVNADSDSPPSFHALLDFDTLERKYNGLKEYESIVTENHEFNDSYNRNSLPYGIRISRTKWGDPIACFYLFENNNGQIENTIYLSVELGEPEYIASSIYELGITSIKTIPHETLSYFEKKINAELPSNFKNMLLEGRLFSYDYFNIGQIQFQTNNEVDDFVNTCKAYQSDYKLEGLPIVFASDGMGDHLAIYLENNKVTSKVYRLEHELGTFRGFDIGNFF